MLNQRLKNCVDCNAIPSLLQKIDCKLLELAKDEYNNIVFILNRKISEDVISSLLNYKRILTYKYCNTDYASCYTVDQIASRINVLIFK